MLFILVACLGTWRAMPGPIGLVVLVCGYEAWRGRPEGCGWLSDGVESGTFGRAGVLCLARPCGAPGHCGSWHWTTGTVNGHEHFG